MAPKSPTENGELDVVAFRDYEGICDYCGEKCDSTQEDLNAITCSFDRCPQPSVYHQRCLDLHRKRLGGGLSKRHCPGKDRLAWFPCPRGCGKATNHDKPCPGTVKKTHPVLCRNDESKKRKKSKLPETLQLVNVVQQKSGAAATATPVAKRDKEKEAPKACKPSPTPAPKASSPASSQKPASSHRGSSDKPMPVTNSSIPNAAELRREVELLRAQNKNGARAVEAADVAKPVPSTPTHPSDPVLAPKPINAWRTAPQPTGNAWARAPAMSAGPQPVPPAAPSDEAPGLAVQSPAPSTPWQEAGDGEWVVAGRRGKAAKAARPAAAQRPPGWQAPTPSASSRPTPASQPALSALPPARGPSTAAACQGLPSVIRALNPALSPAPAEASPGSSWDPVCVDMIREWKAVNVLAPQLESMGFPLWQCVTAVRRCGSDLMACCDWLLRSGVGETDAEGAGQVDVSEELRKLSAAASSNGLGQAGLEAAVVQAGGDMTLVMAFLSGPGLGAATTKASPAGAGRGWEAPSQPAGGQQPAAGSTASSIAAGPMGTAAPDPMGAPAEGAFHLSEPRLITDLARYNALLGLTSDSDEEGADDDDASSSRAGSSSGRSSSRWSSSVSSPGPAPVATSPPSWHPLGHPGFSGMLWRQQEPVLEPVQEMLHLQGQDLPSRSLFASQPVPAKRTLREAPWGSVHPQAVADTMPTVSSTWGEPQPALPWLVEPPQHGPGPQYDGEEQSDADVLVDQLMELLVSG